MRDGGYFQKLTKKSPRGDFLFIARYALRMAVSATGQTDWHCGLSK
jgi:hypothetical protein